MSKKSAVDRAITALKPFIRFNEDGSFVAPRDEHLDILLSVVERQREALESAKSVLATRCASIKDHTNSEIVTLKKICAALGESNDA